MGWSVFLALGLVQLAPAPVAARGVDARAHYQAAMQAYRGGQFPVAITEFKAADALSPSPVLSYDIAEAYEKAADLRNARFYYQEYLRRAPAADDRSRVEAQIASIDTQLAAQSAAAPPLVTEQAAPPPPNRSLSYVLMGLGVAGLATAVALQVAAAGAASALVNAPHPQPGVTAQGDYDRGTGLLTGAIVSYVLGGVVLGTGGTIFLAQSLSHPASDADADTDGLTQDRSR